MRRTEMNMKGKKKMNIKSSIKKNMKKMNMKKRINRNIKINMRRIMRYR